MSANDEVTVMVIVEVAGARIRGDTCDGHYLMLVSVYGGDGIEKMMVVCTMDIQAAKCTRSHVYETYFTFVYRLYRLGFRGKKETFVCCKTECLGRGDVVQRHCLFDSINPDHKFRKGNWPVVVICQRPWSFR